MKLKFPLLFIAILLLSLACSAPSSSLEVTCSDFRQQQHMQKDLTLSAGDEITVSLCSNPSTGFQWLQRAQISDNRTVEQVNYRYIAPGGQSGQPPASGAAGTSVWTFKALKSGKATVEMEYSRQWEGGEKRQWTCMLSITVR